MGERVLILCTGNSCRSQLAEALWRELGGGAWQAASAGSRPAGFVHPLAVRAMREVGLDLAAARSKSIDDFADERFDLVVTVCDAAKESCPILPEAKRTLHWPFEDPALAVGTEEERLDAFRRVRDEIAAKIRSFLKAG
jgi:arsenate reductase